MSRAYQCIDLHTRNASAPEIVVLGEGGTTFVVRWSGVSGSVSHREGPSRTVHVEAKGDAVIFMDRAQIAALVRQAQAILDEQPVDLARADALEAV